MPLDPKTLAQAAQAGAKLLEELAQTTYDGGAPLARVTMTGGHRVTRVQLDAKPFAALGAQAASLKAQVEADVAAAYNAALDAALAAAAKRAADVLPPASLKP